MDGCYRFKQSPFGVLDAGREGRVRNADRGGAARVRAQHRRPQYEPQCSLFRWGGLVSRYPGIFRRLFLRSIDASDSESRLIFSHFSRSTQLSNCIFRILLIFASIFKISSKFPDFCKILLISQQIGHFLLKILQNFAGIAGKCKYLLELNTICRIVLKI